MKWQTFMIIAGDPSGDLLAAELVAALRELIGARSMPANSDSQPLETNLNPRFFGAGGPQMQIAGVDLACEMTHLSLIGISDVLKKYFEFRRLFRHLLTLAIQRQPEVIVCVDFSGFNRRFAHAIRKHVRPRLSPFRPWNPRIVQYVSPQVWASREGRVRQLAEDFNLVLSTIPFEKNWYASRAPHLSVEFVGNPVIDRYGPQPFRRMPVPGPPRIVLLPGSRAGELQRHLPLLKEAARKIASRTPAQFVMVLPRPELLEPARTSGGELAGLTCQIGDLAGALSGASLALTKSGTVTLECAIFGVPSVVFYKTSAINYAIGKRIIKVKHIAMPNLLAGETVFPELIQEEATSDNIAAVGLKLLTDAQSRSRVELRLREVVASLGRPGASRRAAGAILHLI